MTERELTTEVLMLTLLCQQGSASDEERARLEYLLSETEQARLLYMATACDSVTLMEVSNSNTLSLEMKNSTDASTHDCVESLGAANSRRFSPKRGTQAKLLFAIAASVLLAGWALFAGWDRNRSDHVEQVRPDSSVVNAPLASNTLGRVVHLEEVVWEPGAAAFSEWSRLTSGDALRIKSGMVELLIDDAVQVVLQGPAHFELVSSQKALAHSGKLVARVGKEGIGFEIDTPHAQVIDQGTAFSMNIMPAARTDVVVYEGAVDLATRMNKASMRRLQSGEGVQVDSQGRLNRITSVISTDFLPPLRLGRQAIPSSSLIRGVTDNVVSLKTTKYYRIVGRGFDEDCLAYVDRAHQWNGIDQRGIPAFLKGADYVMTYNDDKVIADLQIAIELSQPTSLYVMWDDRVEVPQWLASAFTDTGWDIGLDEGYPDRFPTKSRLTAVGKGESVDFVFSIWKQDFRQPTTAVLGSVRRNPTDIIPREVSQSMYGIAVTPL